MKAPQESRHQQPSSFQARAAARLNPDLAINPDVTTFGLQNAILSGTSRRYCVSDFAGPLSLKATLQGVSTWKVDGRQFRVSESTYLLINKGQPYTIAYDEPADVTTFVLLFKNGYLEQVASSLIAGPTALLDDPFRATPIEAPLRLHSGPSNVLAALHDFANELGRASMSPEIWELRFQSLAVTLLREMTSTTPDSSDIAAVKASTRAELLRRVLIGRDFLISMSNTPVTVEDAAGVACLSRFHFHRVFAQAFGIPPHVFLHNVRLQRAANLLRDTDEPISDIVARVGLRSATSFSGAFRRKYKQTPDAFRKAQQLLHRA